MAATWRTWACEASCAAVRIAVFQGLDQFGHFGRGVGPPAGGRDGHGTKAVDAGVQRLHHAPGDGHAAAGEHGFVEVGGARHDLGKVVAAERGMDAVIELAQSCNHVVAGLFGTQPRRMAFKQGADFIDLRGLPAVEPRNHRTLIGNRLDQAFGLQVPQHFPDDRPAHVQLRAQSALDQTFAGLEVIVENGVAHFLQRQLTQGLGAAVDLERSGVRD